MTRKRDHIAEAIESVQTSLDRMRAAHVKGEDLTWKLSDLLAVVGDVEREIEAAGGSGHPPEAPRKETGQ